MEPKNYRLDDPLASIVEDVTAAFAALTAELAFVRGVCDAIGIANTAPELCTMLCRTFARAIDSRCVSIFWGDAKSPFRLQAQWTSSPLIEDFPATIAGSPVALTLEESGKPILIHDLSSHPLRSPEWPFPSDLVAFFLVPLVFRKKVRGTVCFCDNRPNIFDESKFLAVMSVVPPVVSTMTRLDPGGYERGIET